MKKFRNLYLFVCDNLLMLLEFLRGLAKLGPGDVSEESLKQYESLNSDVFVYDLVIDRDIYTYNLRKIEEGKLEDAEPRWGNPFNIGTVVGFVIDKTNPTKPSHIKVAQFNTAEFNKPEIRLYKPEQLVILDSPIRNIQIAARFSAAAAQLQEDLTRNKGEIETDEDLNVIESIFSDIDDIDKDKNKH